MTSPCSQVDSVFFLLAYLIYMIISLILLLNLLIGERELFSTRSGCHTLTLPAHVPPMLSPTCPHLMLWMRCSPPCPASPAMMSTTYESILERSVLEWRVDFARLILKIELECESTSHTQCPLAPLP